MFSLLTLDAARDAVARQFDYDEPQESVAATTPAAPASTHRRRSNPFVALAERVHGSMARATWSPTR